MTKKFFLFLAAVLVITFASVMAKADEVAVIYGSSALQGEIHAAGELAVDIERVYGFRPDVLAIETVETVPAGTSIIAVGTVESNPVIEGLVSAGAIEVSAENPGPEAFVLESVTFKGFPALAIAGCDERGVLYGVYEFSRRFLGVDPYEYWTGKEPARKDRFEIPDISFREKPPVFPLRGYFDNDNDMIANWRGEKLIIEFDTWKEMIDSLARLRYNYIDLHDTLGRAEFWTWEYYLKNFPGYHTDLELVDRIIDYAHSKGMLVQIPMYLGWEFHHLPYEKLCLSKYHDDWMEVYRYYLEESPLGKGDLFLQRPRDPWKDHGYKCVDEIKAGIDPGPLMEKMFNGLLALVEKHRQGGKVVCDLWAEGRDMWRAETFNPDRRIDMLWADGGYANYSKWPEDFKGHDFGIYIHAGYYKNHVMQDPYPQRIKDATMEAYRRGMTANYFVNGQDFKHFILNMEACALAAWDPEGFDPDSFYLDWTSRYFGEDAAPTVVKSLEKLHEASDRVGGFTMVMGYTEEIVTKLRLLGHEHINMERVDTAISRAEESLSLAREAAALVPEGSELVYDDQVLFPAKIYLENLKLYKAAAETMNAFHDRRSSELSPEGLKEAAKRLDLWKKRFVGQLIELRGILDEGSKWGKWDGWTKPENFRKITPPPDPDEVKRIVLALQ